LAEVKAAKEALAEEVHELQRSGQQMKMAYERQAADYQRLVEVREQLEESLAAKQEAVLAGKREASEAASAAQQQRADLTEKVARMETEVREARAAVEGNNRSAADLQSRLNSDLEEAREKVRETEGALKRAKGESAGALARLEGQVKQLEADVQAREFERDRVAAQVLPKRPYTVSCVPVSHPLKVKVTDSGWCCVLAVG
jgi:chromosome segregation ATPase